MRAINGPKLDDTPHDKRAELYSLEPIHSRTSMSVCLQNVTEL